MQQFLTGGMLRVARFLTLATATIWSGASLAQSAPPSSPATVTVPSFILPYSSFNSPEAISLMERQRQETPLPSDASIQVARAYYGPQNDDRARRMRETYDVKIVETTIGGVSVQRVTPTAGIAPENRGRVLINLHGGAFMWGAGSGALAEAIPIAAVGKIEVITVDYRMAPEHRFPAASEDVASVYKALLANYAPRSIGIYGCSAGGVLTAESIAWFIDKNIPVPGAIGTFCGSVAEFGGDSLFFGAAAAGKAPEQSQLKLSSIPYFVGASAQDPLVFPGVSRAVLSHFPPTLLITGTRDFAMSSVVHSNELLRAAGVKTELRIWDGMYHAFFVDPEPVESKQVYRAIVDFFHDHLTSTPEPRSIRRK